MSPNCLLLSYHHGDKKTVEQVSQVLAERGLDVRSTDEIDQATLEQAQAVAICLGPQGLSLRQKRDIAQVLTRQAKVETETTGQLFPVIPILLPGADPAPAFLFRHAWVDLRASFNPTALDKLVAAARQGSAPLRPIATLIDWSPYRGWKPFREEDAAFFFGREAITRALLTKVSEQNLVILAGPAGSGKTSVVRAGLLPHLRHPSLPPSQSIYAKRPIPDPRTPTPTPHWDVLSFTPGNRPFYRLAATLIEILEPELSIENLLRASRRLSNQLAGGEIQVTEIVEQLLTRYPNIGRWLLIIDQFEELFSQTPSAERYPFVEALLCLLNHPHLSLLIVLQAEFYRETVALCPELSHHLERRLVYLDPPTQAELEAALVKRVRPVNLAFEPGLVERLLGDVTSQPDPLLCLEFALWELWQRHQWSLLRHSVYEQIGGVSGAVAYRAEQLFQGLTPKQQTLARRILTRLVQCSPDGRLTSRPTHLADFSPSLQSTELAQVQRLVHALAEANLLIVNRDEISGEERVETCTTLAHHWPRWQKWLDEEQEFLLWRRHLDKRMSGWERAVPDEKALLQGAALAEAEAWLERRRDSFDSEGRVYIWQSLARHHWEQDRRWLVSIGLIVLLILGIVFIIVQQISHLSI